MLKSLFYDATTSDKTMTTAVLCIWLYWHYIISDARLEKTPMCRSGVTWSNHTSAGLIWRTGWYRSEQWTSWMKPTSEGSNVSAQSECHTCGYKHESFVISPVLHLLVVLSLVDCVIFEWVCADVAAVRTVSCVWYMHWYFMMWIFTFTTVNVCIFQYWSAPVSEYKLCTVVL